MISASSAASDMLSTMWFVLLVFCLTLVIAVGMQKLGKRDDKLPKRKAKLAEFDADPPTQRAGANQQHQRKLALQQQQRICPEAGGEVRKTMPKQQRICAEASGEV